MSLIATSSSTHGRNRHRHHPSISGVPKLPAMPGGCSGTCSDHECTLLQVASQILDRARAQRYKCPHVMEGGSFHVDGEGCEASPITDNSLSLHSQSLHPLQDECKVLCPVALRACAGHL